MFQNVIFAVFMALFFLNDFDIWSAKKTTASDSIYLKMADISNVNNLEMTFFCSGM